MRQLLCRCNSRSASNNRLPPRAASSQLSNLREDFLKVREESRRLKELEAKVITTKR